MVAEVDTRILTRFGLTNILIKNSPIEPVVPFLLETHSQRITCVRKPAICFIDLLSITYLLLREEKPA